MGAANCRSHDARASGVEEIFVQHVAGVEDVTTGASTSRAPRRLGWKRDLPDFRDRVLALPKEKTSNLPGCVDLRKGDLLSFPIYDQGGLGSCTANAICAGIRSDQLKQGFGFVPSRLFVYYNQCTLGGTTGQDSGAYIRDGIKSVHKLGVCSEGFWHHVEAKFAVKPDDACYIYAAKHKCLEYARVKQTVEDMRACLSEGFSFVFGFMVFSSFCSQKVTATGQVPMPQADESNLGGHAALCVGYDDERQAFIVRNSWGECWGDSGYFYMPYAYLSDASLSGDMWMMRNVDGPTLPTEAVSKHVPPAGPAVAAAAHGRQATPDTAECRKA